MKHRRHKQPKAQGSSIVGNFLGGVFQGLTGSPLEDEEPGQDEAEDDIEDETAIWLDVDVTITIPVALIALIAKLGNVDITNLPQTWEEVLPILKEALKRFQEDSEEIIRQTLELYQDAGEVTFEIASESGASLELFQALAQLLNAFKKE